MSNNILISIFTFNVVDFIESLFIDLKKYNHLEKEIICLNNNSSDNTVKKINELKVSMNIPNLKLACPCCDCAMISDLYDITRYGGITPVQDISGVTSYAISMWYTCSNCKESYKGNDGGLFNQISSHYRRAYPVAPRYAVGYDVHLTEPTTRVLKNLMLTYGNGDMLSRLLHELQAMAYEDTEENYYDNVNDLEIKISKQLPKFSDYGPRVSGQSIRDCHNYAATSELTSTGISDVMRQT